MKEAAKKKKAKGQMINEFNGKINDQNTWDSRLEISS